MKMKLFKHKTDEDLENNLHAQYQRSKQDHRGAFRVFWEDFLAPVAKTSAKVTRDSFIAQRHANDDDLFEYLLHREDSHGLDPYDEKVWDDIDELWKSDLYDDNDFNNRVKH